MVESQIMVARIEVKPTGEEWIFERNVMPGTSEGLHDPLLDGGEEIIVVVCDKNDEFTLVSRIKDGEYVISDDESVDIFKEPDVTLRLGDPHYLTTVQSIASNDRIEVRIPHQDIF